MTMSKLENLHKSAKSAGKQAQTESIPASMLDVDSILRIANELYAENLRDLTADSHYGGSIEPEQAAMDNLPVKSGMLGDALNDNADFQLKEYFDSEKPKNIALNFEEAGESGFNYIKHDPDSLISQLKLSELFDDTLFTDAKAASNASEQELFYAIPGPISASALPIAPSKALDVNGIRSDFPALHQNVNGRRLIWLDNAATTQKPRSVIDTITRFYEHDNSNIHRAAHTMAVRATNAYEGAREKVRLFLGAASSKEIIFVRGATEAINLVAQSYGMRFIGSGDEIILSTLEHHSNIVPWQLLAQAKGAILRVIPINDSGEIILEEYEKLLGPKTRLVAITQVSNALGTVVPLKTIIDMAHRNGTRVLVDGAQGVPHFRVNVQEIDADFYAFSGHKLFGPTGIGVLYAKKDLLQDMPPWQGGGNMIDKVTFEKTTYSDLPNKFEAGTGSIADAVGLGAAIDYLNKIGAENIEQYEQMLMTYASNALGEIPGLRQIGTASNKTGVLSFIMDGISPEELASKLDKEGIAVRAGHHCAQPALRHFGLTSTVRPSIAFYNTTEEIDMLVEAIIKAKYGAVRI